MGRRSPSGPLGGAVLGGGERVEGLLQHRAGQGVEGEPAVDLAVPVVPHRRAGWRLGVAFLASRGAWLRGRRRRRGQTTSRMRRPRFFSALASWSAARSSRCRSALLDAARGRGRRAGRRGRGGWPRPARRGSGPRRARSRVRSWSSRPGRAASSGARPGGWCGWWWACQFAVEVAPVWPATSMRSAWVRSRASSSASWALAAWTSVDGRGGLVGVHRPQRDVGRPRRADRGRQRPPG